MARTELSKIFNTSTQGLAAALRPSPKPPTFGLGEDITRGIALILHARSAVGYNPMFGGNVDAPPERHLLIGYCTWTFSRNRSWGGAQRGEVDEHM